MKRTFLLLASLTFASWTSAALQPSIVGADAQWVLHLDLNTFRTTKLGHELITFATAQQKEQTASPLHLDIAKLLTTVGSATAYGTNFSKDPKQMDGTLILQGTAELRKIAEAYVAQATVSQPEIIAPLKDFPVEAYSVGKDDKVIIAFPPEPIILVGKAPDQLLQAREVFRGKVAGLNKANQSPLKALLAAKGDAYFQAASVIPAGEAFAENAPQARILQMTRSVALTMGETNENVFARLSLLAASEEMGEKLSKILQGFAAMASLAETNDQHLTEFLQSISVKRDSRNVTLDLLYPSVRLAEIARSLSEKKTASANRPASGKPPRGKPEGKVIAEWTADADLGDDSPAKDSLVEHTVEHVALTQGCTLVLTGRSQGGEHARIDVVEITSTGGNQPLRFEAERMQLRNYHRETLDFASGGRVIKTQGEPGVARFPFPAADGSYTVTVRYLDEKDGQSVFTLSVVNADTEVDVEQP